jgi:hypothetical protein
MTELIGWMAATVLLATMGRQVYTQWRDGTSQGVSKWLFVGQLAASFGPRRLYKRHLPADLGVAVVIVNHMPITAQIGADNLHNEFSIGRCSRWFVRHSFSPTQTDTCHTRSTLGGDLGSP